MPKIEQLRLTPRATPGATPRATPKMMYYDACPTQTAARPSAISVDALIEIHKFKLLELKRLVEKRANKLNMLVANVNIPFSQIPCDSRHQLKS